MGLFSLFGKSNKFESNRNIDIRKMFSSDEIGNYPLVLCNKPYVFIPEKERSSHLVLIGGTGRGKSNIFKVMLAQDIVNGAGVIMVDPKADMFDFILRLATKANRIVSSTDPTRLQLYSFDLLNDHSPTWNPLIHDDCDFTAEMLYEGFYADDATTIDYYKNTGRVMLRSLVTLLKAYGKPINLNDLFLSLFNRDITNRIYRDFKGNDKYTVQAEFVRKIIIDRSEKDAEQLTSGLVAKLEPYITSKWAHLLMSYNPDIIVKDIIKNGDIMHYGIRSKKLTKAVYAPLVKMFNISVKEAVSDRFRSKNNNSVYYYADEYGDVASSEFIDGLKQFRSGGIGFNLAFQDLSDLGVRGEYLFAQTLGNSFTKILLNLPNPETADYLSKLIGTYDNKIMATQSFDSEGKTKGQVEKLDNRSFKITPDYIKNMDKGQCVAQMPYLVNNEIAVYKYRSPLVDDNAYGKGDYDLYNLMWRDLPKDESIGLNIESWNKVCLEGNIDIKDDGNTKGKAKKPSRIKKKVKDKEQDIDECIKSISDIIDESGVSSE